MVKIVYSLHSVKDDSCYIGKKGQKIKTQQFLHFIISKQAIGKYYSYTFYIKCSDKHYMILHNLTA